MAKTSAERMRELRERQRAAREAAPEQTESYLRTPFNVAFSDYEHIWSLAEQSLDEVGIEPPTFDDDTDPQWRPYWSDEIPNRRSIGRAERMVGALLDSATTLADIINRFKRKEIEQAIADLENADFTDHFVKQKALADIVKLTKIRDRLDKQVRWTLPEWKVKGE